MIQTTKASLAARLTSAAATLEGTLPRLRREPDPDMIAEAVNPLIEALHDVAPRLERGEDARARALARALHDGAVRLAGCGGVIPSAAKLDAAAAEAIPAARDWASGLTR